MKKFWITLLPFSATVVILTAQHSSPAQTKPDNNTQSSHLLANLLPDQIGVADLIRLQVANSSELSRTFRVDGQGYLDLPLLNAPVLAKGLTTIGIRDEIVAALRERHLLLHPIVDVSVAEYTSHEVTISGAVRAPTTAESSSSLHLLGALALAGGISPRAGQAIIVQHEDGSSQRISILDLLDGYHPHLNIAIEPGAQILIPEAEKVFVMGDVKQPGAFALSTAEDTTVLQLLALSGGLGPHRHHMAYVYRNIPASPQEAKIPVPLQEILDRKRSDVKLLPGDILYVPSNGR